MFVTLQSNEVTSSNACELEAMKRFLAFLQRKGLIVDSMITDRHKSVAKQLRVHHPTVEHFFDTWHAAKGGTVDIFIKNGLYYAVLTIRNTDVVCILLILRGQALQCEICRLFWRDLSDIIHPGFKLPLAC